MSSPADLTGKRALVFGVASEDSIAWAIAKELANHGAKVTMGYQKRFLSRVMGLFKDTPWIEGRGRTRCSEPSCRTGLLLR